MKTRQTASVPYEKISATLDERVLHQIRERTGNVSGFLNDAAKEKLYFDRLAAFADDLRRQGVERDEVFYQNLNKWIDEVDARRLRRRKRRA